MSHGKVRQFTWVHDGQKRRAWGFTVIIDGKRVRRQGYGSRAEAQEALDTMKRPAPVQAPTAPTMTLTEAFDRYFKAKARKRSLAEDQRIARHLKAELGEQTPLAELTASRISAYQEKLLAVQHSRRGGALSAASINRPLALLRGLLRMACRKWEALPAAPVIELEKEGQGRLRWLTHEEALYSTPAASRRTPRWWIWSSSRSTPACVRVRRSAFPGATWTARGASSCSRSPSRGSVVKCPCAGRQMPSWPAVRATGRPRGWYSARQAGTPSGSTGSGP